MSNEEIDQLRDLMNQLYTTLKPRVDMYSRLTIPQGMGKRSRGAYKAAIQDAVENVRKVGQYTNLTKIDVNPTDNSIRIRLRTNSKYSGHGSTVGVQKDVIYNSIPADEEKFETFSRFYKNPLLVGVGYNEAFIRLPAEEGKYLALMCDGVDIPFELVERIVTLPPTYTDSTLKGINLYLKEIGKKTIPKEELPVGVKKSFF